VSVTTSDSLYGYHPPEYSGDVSFSSTPQTGTITTTKTNQNAPGFTANAFKSRIPGVYECVFASWNLLSGPYQYRQDQPVKLCKQPVKTDYHVTLTGPRAPTVGFVSEYEIKTTQLIQSASGVNPVVRLFLPEHATFVNIDWAAGGHVNSVEIQCTPETPIARVIRCTGSGAGSAIYTLRVRHSITLAETFRVEVSSDTPERNPSDNTASLTILPILENTATDLRVTGHTITSSSVFVEDQFEQIVTIKNIGPGVAGNATIGFSRSGYDHNSIVPLIPEGLTGCQAFSLQVQCVLPALNAGEELTVHVPWRADHPTSNGGDRLQVVVEYQNDTNTSNNSDTTLEHVQVARDPLKEHALEVSLNATQNAIEGQTHTSSVTVTNHGPNVATSRSLVFTPSFLIPVSTPAGCTQDLESSDIFCSLTGMTANTSRTLSFVP
jgi:CARDB